MAEGPPDDGERLLRAADLGPLPQLAGERPAAPLGGPPPPLQLVPHGSGEATVGAREGQHPP